MHAREYMNYRGATEEEVAEAIRDTPWNLVQEGRFECGKDFVYRRVGTVNSTL